MPITDAYWRQTHLGRIMVLALERFNQRVLELMAHDPMAPMTLMRLATRRQISAAHIHLLQHLPTTGTRLTTLARDAAMSKQAMAQAISQCLAWGLVEQRPDPIDQRARLVVFTDLGLTWLGVYSHAVAKAEEEFNQLAGNEIATVVKLGLEAYAGGG